MDLQVVGAKTDAVSRNGFQLIVFQISAKL